MATILLLSAILGALLKLLALALVGALIVVVWKFRSTAAKVNALVERVQVDAAPLISHANSIAENVNFVTRGIKGDVATVNATIAEGNARVRDAIAATERRLQDFNALLEVVQAEAEQLFVSSASAVRGVRSGAAALGLGGARLRRRGPEFAVDDVDGAELEDDFGAAADDEDDTDDREMADGYDRATESTEDDGGRTAAPHRGAHPRIGPRTRRHG